MAFLLAYYCSKYDQPWGSRHMDNLTVWLTTQGKVFLLGSLSTSLQDVLVACALAYEHNLLLKSLLNHAKSHFDSI